MINGALKMCQGLLVVGIDEEASEAKIGRMLPGGSAPGGVILWAVLFGPEVESAEGDRALHGSSGDLIPFGIAVAGLDDTRDVGALNGECLVEVGVCTSGAFLLEKGEGADPVGVDGGADVPVNEIAKAAAVSILDGVGWMEVGARRRRGDGVFRGDVRMRLSTLRAPEGGELDGVLIQASVRVKGEGREWVDSGREAILWLEGANLGLKGAGHPGRVA